MPDPCPTSLQCACPVLDAHDCTAIRLRYPDPIDERMHESTRDPCACICHRPDSDEDHDA